MKLNPMGRVPLLQEADGTVLLESFAIGRYLCDLNGPSDLYPTDPKTRANIDMHLGVCNEIRQQAQIYVAATIAGRKIPQTLVQNGYDTTIRIIKEYDEQYLAGDNAYLVGDTLTLVDVNMYCIYLIGQHLLQIKFGEQFPNVYKYVQGLKAKNTIFEEDEAAFVDFLAKS